MAVIPVPTFAQWKPRPVSAQRAAEAERLGASALQARWIAARIPDASVDLGHVLDPRPHVLQWQELPDIHPAAERIADAVEHGEVLSICVDHDCDGITSHAIIHDALINIFGVRADRVHSITSHRTKEGYGVSSRLVERVLRLDPRPTLLITADQGSTDEPRIRELKAHGVSTVVSDHHGLPKDGPPVSAVACVNPARTDIPCRDPTIAGCMVALLLMSATRAKLEQRGLLAADAPTLAHALDAAAIGTVADAVNLGASATNRFVVRAGLKRMNALTRPFLQALDEVEPGPWDSQSIAFKIGPITNAYGRINDATAGLEAFTTTDPDRARELVAVMRDANERRKVIQKALTATALDQAALAVEAGCQGLALILADGHPGVHGVVASRIVETFGLATVCLSPHMEDAGVLTGSVRSVPGVDARRTLALIAEQHPELDLAYGGHPAAAGLRLPEDRGLLFCAAWDATVTATLNGAPPALQRMHDGPLGTSLGPAVLADIAGLEPWGRGFELPVFCDAFQLTGIKPVGDGTHVRLELTDNSRRHWNAIWFRAIEAGAELPLVPGPVRLVYSLAVPGDRSRQSVEIHVKAAEQGLV